MTDEEQPPSDSEQIEPMDEGMSEGMSDDGGFDEFEEEGGGKKIRDLIDNNPMVKFGLVGAVIVVLIGGMMIFGGGKKKDKNFSMVTGDSGVKEAPGTAPVSSTYRKAMEEKNQQNVEQAIKTGNSSLPVPIATPTGRLTSPDNAQPTEDPLERWRRIQDERTRREQEQRSGLPQQDPNAQAIKDMAAAMSTQMQSILGGIKTVKIQNMEVTTEKTIETELENEEKKAKEALSDHGTSGTNGTTSGTNGTDQNGNPVESVQIIVPAGTIGYAQLITGANSDYKQPVLGVIVGGPLSGDRIIGSFKHDSEKDYMTLNFDKVIIDGISHTMNALAVDPASDYSNLATDVDHHYFKRVVIPGAVAFVQALASGISQPGQTTSQTSTSTIVTTPKLTPAQYFWEGLGTSTAEMGKQIDKENKDTDTTVVVAPGTPIGLIFVDPVTDKAANVTNEPG